MGTVLGAIVKVEPPGKSKFGHGLLQSVLHNALLHAPVELTMQDVPGGIVNQAGKVSLRRLSSQIEGKAILNIALPQIMPVDTLEALGGITLVIVEAHHGRRISGSAHGILQGGSL